MQDLNNDILNSFNFNIMTYYRYVDDIFLIAPENKVDTILGRFNSQHERIKFTIEKE